MNSIAGEACMLIDSDRKSHRPWILLTGLYGKPLGKPSPTTRCMSKSMWWENGREVVYLMIIRLFELTPRWRRLWASGDPSVGQH